MRFTAGYRLKESKKSIARSLELDVRTVLKIPASEGASAI